jgi:hypothetical protein
MESAFGVEHGDQISKFRFDPTSMSQAQQDAAKKGKKTFRFDSTSMKEAHARRRAGRRGGWAKKKTP